MDQSGTFKILIASDCHIGYNEKHPIRGDDSFRSFEEILQSAQKLDVDFILLAGDLFHVNRPSVETMRKAMFLIRKYCFGGDGTNKFSIKNFKRANVLDPNLKVKYPIFTIHGNHDDPIGIERACCLDLFSTSGLINYFGKQDHVESLTLKPIIMEKNQTKMLIYGFGSMREERLNHLIQSNRFDFMTPDVNSESELKKYFKILLVHQNRVPRPNIKHLNPYDLTDVPDLVIWGHEHQAIESPEYFEPNKFFILQPGSTVATSLCEAEHGDKYFYVLNLCYDPVAKKPKFKIDSHRCQTVRPFIIKTINVDEIFLTKTFKSISEQQKYLYNYCKKEVKNMLVEALCKFTEYHKDDKPLLRLRIEYKEKDQLFDRRHFESELNQSVANNDDIVRFIKKHSNRNPLMYEQVDFEFFDMLETMDDMKLDNDNALTILGKYFLTANIKQRLSIFDENFFNQKSMEFMEKNQDPDVIKDFILNTKQAINAIITDDTTIDYSEDLRDHIRIIKNKIANDPKYHKKLEWIVKEPFSKRKPELLKQKVSFHCDNFVPTSTISIDDNNVKNGKNNNDNDDDDDFYKDDIDLFADDDDKNTNTKKKTTGITTGRGKGRAAAAGTTTTRTTTTTVAKNKKPIKSKIKKSSGFDSDDDDDNDDKDKFTDRLNLKIKPSTSIRDSPKKQTTLKDYFASMPSSSPVKTTTTTTITKSKIKNDDDEDNEDDDDEDDFAYEMDNESYSKFINKAKKSTRKNKNRKNEKETEEIGSVPVARRGKRKNLLVDDDDNDNDNDDNYGNIGNDDEDEDNIIIESSKPKIRKSGRNRFISEFD